MFDTLAICLIFCVGFVFTVSLILELRINLMWLRQAMEYIRERRHQREMEAKEMQIQLEKAKGIHAPLAQEIAPNHQP